MHSKIREYHILKMLEESGFVSFDQFEKQIKASPATLRRDLEKLSRAGKLFRVRGGANSIAKSTETLNVLNSDMRLSGIPFHVNIEKKRDEKRRIGQAAAQLCVQGEGIMVDGGSTTLQMCPFFEGLNLQVLTNSLHIVAALINQTGTRVLVPSGAVFPEQNIILSVSGDPGMPRFHAPKLFMGAASIGHKGIMQADIVLVAAERRLLEQADEVIILVDSTKFDDPSGNVVCELSKVDTVITDDKISNKSVKMLEDAGVKLIVV